MTYTGRKLTECKNKRAISTAAISSEEFLTRNALDLITIKMNLTDADGKYDGDISNSARSLSSGRYRVNRIRYLTGPGITQMRFIAPALD